VEQAAQRRSAALVGPVIHGLRRKEADAGI